MAVSIVLAALNAKYIHTNPAIRCLHAKLQEQGGASCFWEGTVNERLFDLTARLAELPCNIYGFSCYIWNIETTLALASRLKKMFPHRKILLGGPEVSYDSRELLQAHSFIDAILCGEGEESIADAVRFLQGNVPEPPVNLATREHIAQMPPEVNLAAQPFAYGDGIEEIKDRILYYESSRGCPYHCSYCLSGEKSSVRFLPLERAKEELRFFTENGAKLVKFVDRTFNCDRQRAREIWRFLLKQRGETCWHFEIGGHLLEEEDIALLGEAPRGKFQLEIGIQSANPAVLSGVNRSSELQKLRDNILALRERTQVHIHADLIAGLPGEDLESFRHSFDFAYNLRPHALQLGFLKMLKGSAVRQRNDIIFDEKPPYEVLSTDALSFGDIVLLHSVEEALDRFYNSGAFTATRAYLAAYFPSPFGLYKALAERISAHKGAFSEAFLYKTIFSAAGEAGDREIAAQLVKFDFLSRGKRGVLLPFMPFNNKEMCKKALRSCAVLAGLSAPQRSKYCAAANFSLDMEAFLRENKIIRQDCTVLFDYRQKPAECIFLHNIIDGKTELE